MTSSAAIFGCEGQSLKSDEIAFFKEANPWGFILFARNLETPEQIKNLCDDLRHTVGRNAPILIDQEGGRVARLRAPEWMEWLPPLEQMDCVAPENARQAMVLRYRLIAHELNDLGIDVNCAPMVDVPTPDAHEIIMNRCYGRDVDTVAEMGRAVSEGLLAGGVLPIIKHIPGHGRGSLDSHFDLPIVDSTKEELEQTDFETFRRLSDLPMAMTAHIVYPALDETGPATTSKTMIDIIRNSIGFDGLLMTDDLSMKALEGSFADKTNASLDAGCDIVLHCNGVMEEMDQIAQTLPSLSGKTLLRAEKAESCRRTPDYFDVIEAQECFAGLL